MKITTIHFTEEENKESEFIANEIILHLPNGQKNIY
jgi:hypothetical protein